MVLVTALWLFVYDCQWADHLLADLVPTGLPAASSVEPCLRFYYKRLRCCSSATLCLFIDKVGRRIWYTSAFFLATVPMVIWPWWTELGAKGSRPRHGDLRHSLNLYSAESTVRRIVNMTALTAVDADVTRG